MEVVIKIIILAGVEAYQKYAYLFLFKQGLQLTTLILQILPGLYLLFILLLDDVVHNPVTRAPSTRKL